MDETNGTLGGALSHWTGRPTVRQRTAVRQAVGRLLDDLAPERAPPRGAPRPVAVQQHRSPRGCVLQGASGAVSVSWFPAADTDADYGELQVTAWHGRVTRPGSTRRPGDSAVAVQELTLRPVEVTPDVWGWMTTDDTAYDEATLAACCRALLADEAAAEAAAPHGALAPAVA